MARCHHLQGQARCCIHRGQPGLCQPWKRQRAQQMLHACPCEYTRVLMMEAQPVPLQACAQEQHAPVCKMYERVGNSPACGSREHGGVHHCRAANATLECAYHSAHPFAVRQLADTN